MKKLFTKFLSFLLVACFALTVAFGCANSSSQNKNQMKEVYNTYVSYSKEKGETPLSYEEWLKTIKGEKGDKGDTPKLRINQTTNVWEVSYDNGTTWKS